MNRKPVGFDPETLHEQYVIQGLTQQQIAEEHLCNARTVRRALDRLEVSRDGELRKPKITSAEELRRLYVDQGKTLKQCAEYFQCSITTVHKAVVRNKFPLRGTKRRRRSTRKRSYSSTNVQITCTTACILLLLLEQPGRGEYQSEIARRVRCNPATAASILGRLVAAGWATWGTTTGHPGPPRPCYRLTSNGIEQARDALQREYGDSPALILLAYSLLPAHPQFTARKVMLH